MVSCVGECARSVFSLPSPLSFPLTVAVDRARVRAATTSAAARRRELEGETGRGTGGDEGCARMGTAARATEGAPFLAAFPPASVAACSGLCGRREGGERGTANSGGQPAPLGGSIARGPPPFGSIALRVSCFSHLIAASMKEGGACEG